MSFGASRWSNVAVSCAPSRWWLSPLIVVSIFALQGCANLADDHVAVTSTAVSDYTAQKFSGNQTKAETYVFMEGRFFEGVTVDRSLEKISFRQLAESLAVDLAKQQYFPAKDPKSADILIMVHWGVTTPKFGMDELRGRLSMSLDTSLEKGMEAMAAQAGEPGAAAFVSMGSNADREQRFDAWDHGTDSMDTQFAQANNAKLLGYNRHLRKMAEKPFSSPEEVALRNDLSTERYFVIMRAYDLHRQERKDPRALWTVYVNTRSPGHNFNEAIDLMGRVASNFAGRQTDDVESFRPTDRQGKVRIGDVVIVGESR